MIITRSPLRISLGGGGTDLPSYYQEQEGFVLSAAINRYVYVTVNRPFNPGIYLKYSSIESVSKVDEIKHPIFRESIRLMNLKTPQVEITSLADIPAGTGLGSSGSFTTALLKAIHTYYRKNLHSDELAKLACQVELEILKEPIGKQDQYISALGGITNFEFRKDGSVAHNPLNISNENISRLEDNLLLFFTGTSRSASEILSDQNKKSVANNSEMIKNLDYIKSHGFKIKEALEVGDLDTFAELMNEHWQMKKKRSQGMSSNFIDNAYELALKNGALGGKLVGAGGGGFLLFYASDKEKLQNQMSKLGLEQVRFGFDFEGTKVILA